MDLLKRLQFKKKIRYGWAGSSNNGSSAISWPNFRMVWRMKTSMYRAQESKISSQNYEFVYLEGFLESWRFSQLLHTYDYF